MLSILENTSKTLNLEPGFIAPFVILYLSSLIWYFCLDNIFSSLSLLGVYSKSLVPISILPSNIT